MVEFAVWKIDSPKDLVIRKVWDSLCKNVCSTYVIIWFLIFYNMLKKFKFYMIICITGILKSYTDHVMAQRFRRPKTNLKSDAF